MIRENLCIHCDEPVLPEEAHETRTMLLSSPAVRLIHRECAARMVLGSVGHQMGLCSCNGGPDQFDDPPGYTKREAAMAALLYSQGKSPPAIPARLLKPRGPVQ